MKIKILDKLSLTLVELIVAISVLGFIIIAVIGFNLIGEKFYHSTEKQALLLNDARYLIEQIGKDIKEAQDVEFTGDTLEITSWKGTVATYLRRDSKIYYINPSKGVESEQLFASNVELFDVQKNGKQVRVEINLKVEKPETKLKEESHYVSVFTMRN